MFLAEFYAGRGWLAWKSHHSKQGRHAHSPCIVLDLLFLDQVLGNDGAGIQQLSMQACKKYFWRYAHDSGNLLSSSKDAIMLPRTMVTNER